MNPVAKIAITGVNLAASALVGKGLSYVWKGVTGNEPPTIAPDRAQRYYLGGAHLGGGYAGEHWYCPRPASLPAHPVARTVPHTTR